MGQGVITRAGRVLTARLLLGEQVEGITHCALGEGDASFTDPLQPPPPDVFQTALRSERLRKRCYKRTFLVENPEGGLLVGGQLYSQTDKRNRRRDVRHDRERPLRGPTSLAAGGAGLFPGLMPGTRQLLLQIGGTHRTSRGVMSFE
ncbi:MAG: hypothetical protein SF028_07510 [Candidatus Sumerlaeia bacterium]|nr:hypothetical protein [Candidatus Sumerlaeia bacterium]